MLLYHKNKIMYTLIYYDWDPFKMKTKDTSYLAKYFNTLKSLNQWKNRNKFFLKDKYYILENGFYIKIINNKKINED